MRIHNGRPEVCTLCSKRFCRPVDLKLHMRRHTGEKPFLCVHCGQGFVQRSHLTEHTRIHSEERPYQCPYCEKAFKQNSSLKQHVDIHLGSYGFVLDGCYCVLTSLRIKTHRLPVSVAQEVSKTKNAI